MEVTDKVIMDIEEDKKNYGDSDFDEEWQKSVSQEVKEANKKLIERFPFLIPRNAWSGKKITDGKGFWHGNPDEVPEYDYEYTALDEMPEGWRKAFGEQMCQEIMDELVAADLVDDYFPTQIKEKYGSLRWYDNYGTEKLYKEIIPKYEALSEKTCIKCGAPATQYTLGWISPYCDECAKEQAEYDKLISYNEYWGIDPSTGSDK